jgi:hypothetical protein
MSNVIQILNDANARCRGAVRSICAGEHTSYKILAG